MPPSPLVAGRGRQDYCAKRVDLAPCQASFGVKQRGPGGQHVIDQKHRANPAPPQPRGALTPKHSLPSRATGLVRRPALAAQNGSGAGRHPGVTQPAGHCRSQEPGGVTRAPPPVTEPRGYGNHLNVTATQPSQNLAQRRGNHPSYPSSGPCHVTVKLTLTVPFPGDDGALYPPVVPGRGPYWQWGIAIGRNQAICAKLTPLHRPQQSQLALGAKAWPRLRATSAPPRQHQV